jgi:signal transduction histidine kinase
MKNLRPRLRSVLILINLVILALPLGGVAVLRVYESALIRQTESELLAQGAFISVAYESALTRTLREQGRRAPADYGLPLPPAPVKSAAEDARWKPHFAKLDLALDPVYPPPPEAPPAPQPADAVAQKIGAELAPMLRQVQDTTLAGFTVTDYNGTVVAATNLPLGVTLLNHEEIRRALAGESDSRLRQRVATSPTPGLDSISRGSRIRVFVTLPIVYRQRVVGAVLLVRTPANIAQAIYGKRQELSIAGLLLLGLVLTLSALTSLTITRPMRALMEQARRASRGEQKAVIPLPHPVTREVAELSETVAAMALTLETRADYIRNFAAHVSHEFKTPLTAIQGAVELLRDHADNMTAAERTRFLDILNNDALRLERLVRRLLELARADMMTLGSEHCAVTPVLQQIVNRYREQNFGVGLDNALSTEQVAMALETLDSIIANLLDNARQHAGADARVLLRCEVREQRVRISVSDNGAGVSAANAAKIFEPFFTTAREKGNTGLGLAIIRALLAAHGGSIELLPAAQGASFCISLPLLESQR